MRRQLTDEHRAIVQSYIQEINEGRIRLEAARMMAGAEICDTLPVPLALAVAIDSLIERVGRG